MSDISIFSCFFSKSQPKPQNALSTSRPYFFGRTSAGANVSERTAMQTSAVYACVRVLSEAIASLPLQVLKEDDKGAQKDKTHPLYDILHNVPNPEMTSFIFRETLMSHLLLYGNAYAQIIRDNSGKVKALYPLMPNKMDVNRNEFGELYYTYWRNKDETKPKEKSGGVILSRHDVLHITGLSFDGLVGYSPIAMAKNTIGMAIATEEYGASFFANGSVPGGILEHPSTLSETVSIKEIWDSIYKGSKNGSKIAVLEDGLKFHPIGIPPEQAQFLETRRFQLSEIARIFRVPPHMIGDLEKATFSNIEQQSLEFAKYSVEPWLVRWEQSMELALLSPLERKQYQIKFNLDGLLRGDYETRMKGYSIGRQNGWLSANDIRRLDNLNLIPAEDGGDRYLVNGNMIDLKSAGLPYQKNGGNI